MRRRSNQSDMQWYVSLKLTLLIWQKATGSLHTMYTGFHREELKSYFEAMDYIGNKEQGFYAIYKKVKQYQRHVLDPKTGGIWLHYLLDIKFDDKAQAEVIFDLFREMEFNNINQTLLDYARLNRYYEESFYAGQRKEVESLCQRVISFISSYDNYKHYTKRLCSIKNTFLSTAFGVDSKQRFEYMKKEYQHCLMELAEDFFSERITYQIFEPPILDELMS